MSAVTTEKERKPKPKPPLIPLKEEREPKKKPPKKKPPKKAS